MLTSTLQMQNKWQFLSTFGGVDGCYIPMKCPRGGNEARKEYYKFKNFYFNVMMRIVGTDYKFFCTSVRLPGGSNNVCTFQASGLYQNIVRNDFLPKIEKVVNVPNGNELQLPPTLLQKRLQKPFANRTLSRKQSHLNYCLSRVRIVTECAFGQLIER